MRTILALALVGVGGWIMYAVITDTNIVPWASSTKTGTLTAANPPPVSNNPPGNQKSRYGPYPT